MLLFRAVVVNKDEYNNSQRLSGVAENRMNHSGAIHGRG